MRLTLAGIVAGTVLLAIAGCGSDSSTGSSASTASTGEGGSSAAGVKALTQEAKDLAEIPGEPFEVKPLSNPVKPGVKVAYVTCTLPVCGKNDAKEPAAELGYDLDTVPFDIAKGPTDVIRAFEQAFAFGAEYIIFAEVFAANTTQKVFEEAEERGVTLISLGGPRPPTPLVAAVFQGPKQYAQAGHLAAAAAFADAGGPTSIGYAEEPAVPAYATAIKAGVEEAVAEAGEGSELKTTQFSFSGQQEQNIAGFVNFIRTNPDVKYLIGPDPAAFAGLPQALSQANLSDQVTLIVNQPQGPDIQSIKNGELLAGVATENHALLWRAIDLTARMAGGEELGDLTYPGNMWFRLVDGENADDVSGPNATQEGAPVPYEFKNVYRKAWGVEEGSE